MIDKETCAVKLQVSHMLSTIFASCQPNRNSHASLGLDWSLAIWANPRWTVVFAQRAKLSFSERLAHHVTRDDRVAGERESTCNVMYTYTCVGLGQFGKKLHSNLVGEACSSLAEHCWGHACFPARPLKIKDASSLVAVLHSWPTKNSTMCPCILEGCTVFSVSLFYLLK